VPVASDETDDFCVPDRLARIVADPTAGPLLKRFVRCELAAVSSRKEPDARRGLEFLGCVENGKDGTGVRANGPMTHIVVLEFGMTRTAARKVADDSADGTAKETAHLDDVAELNVD
jgi:hypothetical protein